MQHKFAQLDQVRLHYVEIRGGDDLILLLHGFPECWYSWRHQLPLLGQQHHVVAPDLRGFNLSDKPAGIKSYRIERLVNDVVELIQYFGRDKATIIAHDWGAAIAWAVAQRHPEMVSKLVSMQVPPPAAFRANFTIRQFFRSWYMFFFQLPYLPEWWARANDFARIDRMYRETIVRPNAFTAEDVGVYKEALRQPGALTATINYYRANVFGLLLRSGANTKADKNSKIRVPTLFIFAEQDIAIVPETVRGLERFIDAPYRELRIPDSGHWVQNEAVEEVNAALVDFLKD